MAELRVALYTRVSSKEQTEGHSLDTQRAVLTEWAAREGWEVVADFQDAGITATSDKRPAFQAMIAAAEQRLFDAVVTIRRDRFARNALQARVYRERLLGYGVRVLYRDEPNEEDTPAGFLINANFETYAEYFSRELGAKVKRGKAARRAKGMSNGRTPFGYRADWTVDPIEGPVVSELYERYAAGNVSFLTLAEWLNGRGFGPHSVVGKTTFAAATVQSMLQNRTYLGEVAGLPGAHEALVDDALWMRVQATREERNLRPRAYSRRPKHIFLLSGIGRHVACGSPLWAMLSNTKPMYYCSERRKGLGCRASGRLADPIDLQVSERFGAITLPADWQDVVRDFVGSEPGTDPDTERRRLQQRIERARRALLDELVDYDTAKATIQESEAALARLDAPRTFERMGEILTDVRALWPNASLEWKQQAIRSVLDSVHVDLENRKVVRFEPKPAFSLLFNALHL